MSLRDKWRAANWRRRAESAARSRDEAVDRRREIESKLESGYAFCHPESDCEGLKRAIELQGLVEEELRSEVEHLDAIYMIADQESITLGADGNHLGEHEAKGIATTARRAKERLTELRDRLQAQRSPGGKCENAPRYVDGEKVPCPDYSPRGDDA